MTRSFVRPVPGQQSQASLPPSTPDEIRYLVRQAGLSLSPKLMDELLAGFPAFEAMVRRLPRERSYADEPVLTFDATRTSEDAGPETKQRSTS